MSPHVKETVLPNEQSVQHLCKKIATYRLGFLTVSLNVAHWKTAKTQCSKHNSTAITKMFNAGIQLSVEGFHLEVVQSIEGNRGMALASGYPP